MRSLLRIFFIFVLLVMAWGTARASLDRGILTALGEFGPDPWFQVMLLDTYFAFLVFWFWAAYRESSWTSRIAWLVMILVLGNFAIAAYMLVRLSRLRPEEPIENLLIRRPLR